jgi:uncharacterized protein YodC (DUF2158 family)
MPSGKKQETSSAVRWNPGEKVRLKSGGPTMTVRKHGKGGEVTCQWFTTDNLLHEGEFAPESLERLGEGSQGGLVDNYAPLFSETKPSTG